MINKTKNSSEPTDIERLYRKYRNMIYKIARGILSDSELSEDALQETIIKIMKYYPKIEPLSGDAERNYIAAVARNTAINIYNKRHKASDFERLDETEICDERRLVSPDDYAITAENMRKISEEYKSLDLKFRDPLTLCCLCGYGFKDISEILGISERAARYRVNRGKQILAEKLKRGDEDE